MHSSADVAVDSLITVDLGRCLPDLRKQTQFKQFLYKREKFKVSRKDVQKGKSNLDKII